MGHTPLAAGMDLRDIDERLLEFLDDGRVTPRYARTLLASEGKDYSRQYIHERLKRLREHGVVENLGDDGLYELRDDPREND